MGSSYTAPAPENTGQMLSQYAKGIGPAAKATEQQIPGIAGATLAGTQATQPGYNELNLQQLQQFALPEAQIGQQIANSNALSGASTNLAQIQGAGGQAANAGANLQSQLSPGYRGANEAVNAINLNGLSPGETNAVERSLNTSNVGTGNLGVLNPTNTISNALNFGGAFNSKIPLMNSAVTAANGTGFSPVNIALGQPQPQTMSNFGTGMMSPINSTTGAGSAGNAFNFGSGLLGNMTSTNNTEIGAQTQGNIAGGIPNYLASTCCFIFLEAYYGNIPPLVRHYRDKIYSKNKDIAIGYRRMAKWLVPLMSKYTIIRQLVWFSMVKPITNNCVSKKPIREARCITHFWLRLWAITGKGKRYENYDMIWHYPGRRTA